AGLVDGGDGRVRAAGGGGPRAVPDPLAARPAVGAADPAGADLAALLGGGDDPAGAGRGGRVPGVAPPAPPDPPPAPPPGTAGSPGTLRRRPPRPLTPHPHPHPHPR